MCALREEVRSLETWKGGGFEISGEGREEGEETTRNRPNYFVQRSRGSAHFCLFSFQQPHLCFVMNCFYSNCLIETNSPADLKNNLPR